MRTSRHKFILEITVGLALTVIAASASAQAVANNDLDVSVARPAYDVGAGPVVALDEGHNNYHTWRAATRRLGLY